MRVIAALLALLFWAVPVQAEEIKLHCWADPPSTLVLRIGFHTDVGTAWLSSIDPEYKPSAGSYTIFGDWYMAEFPQGEHRLKISVDRYTGRYDAHKLVDNNGTWMYVEGPNVGTCKQAKEPLF